MTFKSGTLSGSVTKSLVDSIVTDAVALGWARVESSHVSSLTTWEVLKNPSSLNVAGVDYYAAFGYSSGGVTLYATVFENWDTTSKMASQFPPNVNNAAITSSLTYNTSASQLFSVESRMFNIEVPSCAVGDRYVYSVTGERVALAVGSGTVGTNTRPGGVVYAGLYERFLSPAADPVPVMVCAVSPRGTAVRNAGMYPGSSSTCFGVAICEPGAQGTSGFSAGIPDTVLGFGGIALVNASAFGAASSLEFYTGQRIVLRAAVMGRGDGGTNTAFLGVRGLAYGIYGQQAPGAQGVQNANDELAWTFAGNTYTAASFGLFMWLLKE